MVFNPDTKTNPQSSPKIVVAGDVCIDWLSIPVESLVSDVDSPPPMNWQLRGGRHMYARRGGARLTADVAGAAGGGFASVLKPPPAEFPLPNLPPEKVITSLLTVGPHY